jgi:hypothetical protein
LAVILVTLVATELDSTFVNHPKDISMKTIHTLAALLIAAGLLTACAKEEPQTTTDAIKENAAEVKVEAAETLEAASDAMKDAAADVSDAATEMKAEAAEAVESTGDAISEGAEAAVDAVNEAATETKDAIKETTN